MIASKLKAGLNRIFSQNKKSKTNTNTLVQIKFISTVNYISKQKTNKITRIIKSRYTRIYEKGKNVTKTFNHAKLR